VEITTTEYKRVTVVEVSGRIDSGTASEFDQAIMDLIAGGQSNLVLDLSMVEFLSSAGLRTLVSARKSIQGSGEITLANPSQRVIDTLDIAGLDVLFKSFPDRESAVGYY
jgi:anti-sigma B factor antagonist